MVLQSCTLCPHSCRVNRFAGEKGFCQAGLLPSASLAALHHWEEPCLSATNGAGTIFFAFCNLRCVFCQNHSISQTGCSREITIERLAAIFLEQQARGAHNIDLVTPTHYVPQIIKALTLARQAGLALPVVYNSNAYEMPDTIASLERHVDIFLPDLKYYDNSYAVRYSAAPDYFVYASQAITKMVDLAGPPVFDAAGVMQRGVIVRHLAVPGLLSDSRNVLNWLWHTFGNTIFISLMNQYTPLYQAASHSEINRRLTTWEYNKLIDYASSLGIENCFIQTGKTSSSDYVPVFDGSGI
jgi:putative pyruvate formate lyase activating enzyme